ncbi:MAG: hypothetical protein ABIS18_04215 [Actinomycetota bacterium]
MKRIALIFLVLMVTCSKSPAPTPNGVDLSKPVATSQAPSTASKLADFRAAKVGGGQVIGSELVGHDVAIWSWAPW